MKTRQIKIILSLASLMWALVGCSQQFAFQEVLQACTPPASSARNSSNPGPIITSPAANTPFNTQRAPMTLAGTCVASYPVTITGTGDTTTTTTDCGTDGTFSVPVTFTSGDGTKQIDVSQEATTTFAVLDRRCFLLETIPPVVTIDGAGANALDIPTTTINIAGNCESSLSVIITSPQMTQTVTTTCTSGRYGSPLTFNGSVDLNSVVVTQTDLAGNTGSANGQYLLMNAPVVTIASPAPNSYVSGTATIAGACTTGINVVLAGTGVATSVTEPCTNAAYNGLVTFTSGDGSKQVTASQTNSVGQIGTAAANYIKDTIPPLVTITSPANNSYVSASSTISGNCVSGLTVTLAGSGVQTPVTATCTSSAYSGLVTYTSGDGSKQVTASQTDAGGLTGTATATYNKDTTAPIVTITSPANNSYVTATATISGTCESGVNVILAGTGVQTAVSATCISSAYSSSITFTAGDGSKAVTATQTDPAGLTGSASATYIKDTIAPVVTITSPANNSYVTATATISGTCESGVNVILAGTGVQTAVTAPCTNSAYSGLVTFTANDGTKQVTATQTDPAGLTGSATATYNKDTTAPVVTITSPANNSYVGASATISGTCESGVNVVLAGTGVQTAVTTGCTSGNYSFAVTFTAGDGVKAVTATQTDPAGLTGSASANYNKDTTPPVVTITSPANNSVVGATATITGACESGYNVIIAGSGAQTPVTAACTNSAYSGVVTFTAGNGTKTITATETDAGGLTGSATATYNGDTVGPVVTITSPANNSVVGATATITGACESGYNVIIAGSGAQTPVTAACTNSAYSGVVTFTAGNGTKTITATETDAGGLTGSATATYNGDTVGPVVTITSPANNSVVSASATISGACETGFNVIIAGSGIQTAVTAACTNSAYSGLVAFTAGNGTKTVTATETDGGGLTGSATATYNGDTVAPVVTITSPANNSVVGASATIFGTCESGYNVILAGTGVQSSVSTSCTSGSYTSNVTFTAGNGTKQVTATETDAQGLSGSATATYNGDTVGPVVTITAPANNSVVGASATITGACETGFNVIIAGSGVKTAVTVACTNSAYSGLVAFTAGNGTKTVTATETDAGGLTGSATATYNGDTVAPVVTITSPANNSTVGTSAAIAGTCESGYNVIIAGSGAQTPVTAACTNSAYSGTVAFTAGNGTKTVTATETDAAGLTGSATATYNGDTIAPVVTITSPANNSTVGASAAIAGTCESGYNVIIAGSGAQTPVTAACTNSAYSGTVTFTAGNGSKTVTATETDAEGLSGSATATYNGDSVAPVVTITAPANNSTVGATATITGACETGFNVIIAGSGVQAAVTAACANSAYSGAVTFTAGNGTKTVTATETDSGGLTGSATATYNGDTVAPVVTFTTPTNNSTVAQTVTVGGTCESGINVVIAGNVSTSVTTACTSGNFSTSITLSNANGSNTITGTQTDPMGLTGSATLTLNVVPASDNGNDVFTSKGPGGRVDIIFADDNSASMITNETSLADKFQNFATDLTGVDWQIGVVTSDCTSGSTYDFCGQLQPMVGAATGQFILTPTTANYVTVFQNTIVRPEANGNCLVTNTCASGNSQPLQSATQAMTLANTNNTGFFRTNSDLAIITISNGHTGSSTLPGYTTPAQVQSTFSGIWGTTKRLITYGIIIQTGDTTCLSSQQAALGGSTAAYMPDVTSLAALTNGTTVSICATDYSITLSDIASSVTNLGNSFDLSHTPTGTVSVTFTPTPSPLPTWTVTGNVITFNPAPPTGTTIDVTYQY